MDDGCPSKSEDWFVRRVNFGVWAGGGAAIYRSRLYQYIVGSNHSRPIWRTPPKVGPRQEVGRHERLHSLIIGIWVRKSNFAGITLYMLCGEVTATTLQLGALTKQ